MDIAKLISLGPKKHSLGAPGGSRNSYRWEHVSKPVRRGGGEYNANQTRPRGEIPRHIRGLLGSADPYRNGPKPRGDAATSTYSALWNWEKVGKREPRSNLVSSRLSSLTPVDE